jgi:hypothetical protein
MTKEEYNQMRKERSERMKRLKKKSPLSPFWAQEVASSPIYVITDTCSNGCEHKEVKRNISNS